MVLWLKEIWWRSDKRWEFKLSLVDWVEWTDVFTSKPNWYSEKIVSLSVGQVLAAFNLSRVMWDDTFKLESEVDANILLDAWMLKKEYLNTAL